MTEQPPPRRRRSGHVPHAVSGLVGRKVLGRRVELGLSQVALSERTGLQPTAITKIETGQRLVSVDDLVVLADALGVDPPDLLP
jgi:transcriptional regulator with XRE-family HTH domain